MAVFSLEMSGNSWPPACWPPRHWWRTTASRPALRETDWEKIAGAATILNKVDIRIDDNPMLSVADMNAKCAGWMIWAWW